MITNLQFFGKIDMKCEAVAQGVFFHFIPVRPCLVQVSQTLGLRSHSPGYSTLTSFQDFVFDLGNSSLVVPIKLFKTCRNADFTFCQQFLVQCFRNDTSSIMDLLMSFFSRVTSIVWVQIHNFQECFLCSKMPVIPVD